MVCATLSGSGSHTLVETVMMSMQLAAAKKGRKKGKAVGRRDGQTILGFDAVVMVRCFSIHSYCYLDVQHLRNECALALFADLHVASSWNGVR